MLIGLIYYFYFVDNFIATALSSHSAKLQQFKENLMTTFRMRKCEPVRILGIRIIGNCLEKISESVKMFM